MWRAWLAQTIRNPRRDRPALDLGMPILHAIRRASRLMKVDAPRLRRIENGFRTSRHHTALGEQRHMASCRRAPSPDRLNPEPVGGDVGNSARSFLGYSCNIMRGKRTCSGCDSERSREEERNSRRMGRRSSRTGGRLARPGIAEGATEGR